MNTSKLLVEYMSPTEGNIITETSQDSKGHTWLHGVFMQSEIKNRNGRIYPFVEMGNAVKSLNEQITSYGGVFGELDHPQSITINMDRISHAITELYMDGNNVIGKAKLLNTPMGLIAQELAKSGVRYGVSSRGAGQVNESGNVAGFQLVTIDLVATPSAPGAMPSTVYESMMNHKEAKILTLHEAVKYDDSAQKYLKEEVKKFVSNLLKK